jgi:hypothetical protein
MADDRTPEQREADAQLAEAVDRVAEAYGEQSAGWVTTEYVVIWARQGWDDDGDPSTVVGTAVPENTVPIHRLLGLFEYAAVRYRKLIGTDDE